MTFTASRWLIPIITLIAIRPVFAQPNNDPLPTMQEVQALYEQKQWQPLLQKSSRLLSLRGPVAQNYDRYQILMWRGEAQLQLKSSPQALSSFKDASDETKEPEKSATARATALLIKRSNNGKFTRKSPTTQPGAGKTIDILDPVKRKDALGALADDEAAALEPKVKAASGGTSLKPIADMFQAVRDLRDAELAAAGATPRTDAIIGPLAEHATKLSGDEVKRLKQRVDKIEKSANQVIDYDKPMRPRPGGAYGGRVPSEKRYKKQGLIGTDLRDLKDIIATCNNITTADKQLADAFGETLGKPLLDVGEEARALASRAELILEADYGHSSSDPAGVR
jgi:hypothetical protein